MTRDQLMYTLMVIQGCPDNFEKLCDMYGVSYPQEVGTRSAFELYSDELLEYLNENMMMLPVVDYNSSYFDFKNVFSNWEGSVSYIHFQECVLVGKSKPIYTSQNRDVGFESYIGTFIDCNGYVFNLEVREYDFKINGVSNKLVLRQACNDSLLRLNLLDEFFDDQYYGFWD